MKITKLFMRSAASLFMFSALIFACLIDANAQSAKQQAAAIKYARAIHVSKIEKGMPRVRFDTWFRRTVGKNMKITWEVNDCGEQTGTPVDRGRDFPMCVEAMADWGEVHISVVLGIGTFKRGITGPRSDMRGVSLSVDGKSRNDVQKLSDLQPALSVKLAEN